jgi:tetratricopeptide (TPR) repeat protein
LKNVQLFQIFFLACPAVTPVDGSVLPRHKLERDLRLLERERSELGDHPFTLFNLGSVYQELGRHAEAIPLLRRSLDQSHPTDSIVRKLFSLLAHCHKASGDQHLALAACAKGLEICREDGELLFLQAVLRQEGGDWTGAEDGYRRLMAGRDDAQFASVVT